MIETRPIRVGEAKAFRELWLKGLAQQPDAFLLTLEEGECITEAQVADGGSKRTHWGAFEDGQLLALAVIRRGWCARLRHTADIGPLYTDPNHQRRGLARTLMGALIAEAGTLGLLQLELTVEANNHAARALYDGLGFVEFGLRPRSVIIDGEPRDDALMLLRLDDS